MEQPTNAPGCSVNDWNLFLSSSFIAFTGSITSIGFAFTTTPPSPVAQPLPLVLSPLSDLFPSADCCIGGFDLRKYLGCFTIVFAGRGRYPVGIFPIYLQYSASVDLEWRFASSHVCNQEEGDLIREPVCQKECRLPPTTTDRPCSHVSFPRVVISSLPLDFFLFSYRGILLERLFVFVDWIESEEFFVQMATERIY